MKLLINLLILAATVVCLWFLIVGIQEPIKFANEKERREQAVILKLQDIRKAQELYREVVGNRFAPTFDTLATVLKTGFLVDRVPNHDPDDPAFQGKIVWSEVKRPVIDEIKKMGINVDSLKFIPFGNGQVFDLWADTITYQKATTEVVECRAAYKDFMGPYVDPKFKRYDRSYNPDDPTEKKYYIKFGDRTKPNLAGNWERF